MNKLIEVEGLCFGYDKNSPVIHDICFSIEEGSITVILGNNGCGKTTLIDCITGFHKLFDGSVRIDGNDIKGMSARGLARLMAYIPQNTSTDISYSVIDFIVFGRNCRLKFGQSPSGDDYRIARGYAEVCGIGHLLNRDIDKLSGGERQLAFIARALTQESPIIVMDEPTSSLDVKNQHFVLSELEKIVAEQHKTIILSSHNPNHALFLNSNVLAMKNGLIVENGVAEDIINLEHMRVIFGEHVCYSDEHGYREISFK